MSNRDRDRSECARNFIPHRCCPNLLWVISCNICNVFYLTGIYTFSKLAVVILLLLCSFSVADNLCNYQLLFIKISSGFNLLHTCSFMCALLIKFLCASVNIYLPLIPWSRVLLEKLTSFQLVKKFPKIYGTQRFITTFKSACHLS
jgi:hypothetical protein